MKINLVRKSISIAPIHVQMLQDIMSWEGIPSESEIMRRAISEYYHQRKPKPKPAYIELLEKRRRPLRTPEDRAVDEVKKNEYKSEVIEKREYDAGMKIVNALYKPKIIKEKDGSYWCQFQTYAMSIPPHVEYGEMKLPFSQLNEGLIANQFEGNKEAIIKIIESKHGESSQKG